jgi:hypothetical protein
MDQYSDGNFSNRYYLHVNRKNKFDLKWPSLVSLYINRTLGLPGLRFTKLSYLKMSLLAEIYDKKSISEIVLMLVNLAPEIQLVTIYFDFLS